MDEIISRSRHQGSFSPSPPPATLREIHNPAPTRHNTDRPRFVTIISTFIPVFFHLLLIFPSDRRLIEIRLCSLSPRSHS